MAVTGKITSARLRNLKPGKLGDGGNLWLLTKQNKQSYWTFKYTISGRCREMGMGCLSDISAVTAREQAKQYRIMVKAGRDPLIERDAARAAAIAEQQAADAYTFREAAEKFIHRQSVAWRNPKHLSQWKNTLEKYVMPIIGDMDVRAIETEHVLEVLDQLWTTKPETASRVRQRIESVLASAIALKKRPEPNPARWKNNLEKLLPDMKKVKRVKHFAYMDYRHVPAFMDKLSKQDGIAAKALQFLIMTAARTGEVIGAQWSEIKDGLWILPPERMKAHVEHRVPLSKQAIALLDSLPHVKDQEFIFPGSRHRNHLSNGSMLAVMHRMKIYEAVPHGFRSAFKNWCYERTNFTAECVEYSLAHQEKDKVKAAYGGTDLLEKRSLLMQQWCDFSCNPNLPADVIPITKRHAQ